MKAIQKIYILLKLFKCTKLYFNVFKTLSYINYFCLLCRFLYVLNKMGDRDKKYDRQLRLWGDHGQRCLESSRICLINVTATGTEILKNLVLPGLLICC